MHNRQRYMKRNISEPRTTILINPPIIDINVAFKLIKDYLESILQRLGNNQTALIFLKVSLY